MINVYDSIRDDNGDLVAGLTKLFIKNINEDDSINEYMNGVACVPEGNGTMFIVDDWLIDQIDKVKFIDGELSVKNGEELDTPQKSDIELQEEELLRQLAELRSQKSKEGDTQ